MPTAVEPLLVVITGHRPNKTGGYSPRAHSRRVALAEAVLKHLRPTRIIVGMALGIDQAYAQAAVNLKIPFSAVIPFRGQESTWPAASQRYYRELLEHADRTEYTTDLDTSVNEVERSAAARALNDRNRHMVRLGVENITAGGNSILVALHDGSAGGTQNCIRDAEKAGLPIQNYWSSWAKHAGL